MIAKITIDMGNSFNKLLQVYSITEYSCIIKVLMGRIKALKNRTAKPSRKFGWKLTATFLLIVAGYAAWSLLRPIPMLHPSQASAHLSLATPAESIAWPATGQAAIALGTGAVLAVNGQQTAVPIASTAKVITALSVLQQKPLKLGE